jgi:hypothetical protein
MRKFVARVIAQSLSEGLQDTKDPVSGLALWETCLPVADDVLAAIAPDLLCPFVLEYTLSGTETDGLTLILSPPYAIINSEGRGAFLTHTQLKEFAGALLRAAIILENSQGSD